MCRPTQAEVEVERKRNAANFYGYGYDLVKLTGELKVRNRLDKPINLEITKELSGEVLDKSDSAQDVQTARGLKQVNPKHVLTWTLELKPDEERKYHLLLPALRAAVRRDGPQSVEPGLG